MDNLKRESRDDDLGRKSLRKHVAVSTDEDRPSKAARTGVLSNTRHLKEISVPNRRISEDKETEADHFVKAFDVKDGVVLPLVWENPGVMVYSKLGTKYPDA